MNHKILKDESYLKAKRNLDIRIEQPLTSSQLAQIAQKIFKKGFKRTFMMFYLPTDIVDDGCYASANWVDKHCTVTIYG